MRYLLMVFILIGFLMVGCMHRAKFTPSDTSFDLMQRTESSDIKIYRTKKPERKYMEIGSVFVNGSNNYSYLAKLLRKEASQNGGDALIDIESSYDSLSATVIRFIE